MLTPNIITSPGQKDYSEYATLRNDHLQVSSNEQNNIRITAIPLGFRLT